MASDENQQKRIILPLLQRANELQASEPKVAYYLRMHALDTGIRFEQRSDNVNKLLEALMSKLEKEKASIGVGPDDAEYCRTFAEGVFNRADRVDREGRATKLTAVTFVASSLFLDMLRQFKPLPSDLEDLYRYALWKGADISKAVREGRVPTPGNGDAAAQDLALPAMPPLPPQDVPHRMGSNMGASMPLFQDPLQHRPSSGRLGPAAGSADGMDDLYDSPLPKNSSHLYQQPPSHFQDSDREGSPGIEEDDSPDSLSSQRRPSFSPDPGLEAARRAYHSDDVTTADAPPQSAGPAAPFHTDSLGSSLSAPDEQALPPRFHRGARVLCHIWNEASPARGTVAKCEWDEGEGQWKYSVALKKSIIVAADLILAPDLADAEAVDVSLEDSTGPITAAFMVATDASRWPPTYVVRLPSGQEVEVTDRQIVLNHRQIPQQQQQQQQQQSQASRFPTFQRTAAAPATPLPAAPSLRRMHPPSLPPPPPPGEGVGSGPPYKPALSAIVEAQKLSKHACSSLGFEDVATAVRSLEQALHLLTAASPHH